MIRELLEIIGYGLKKMITSRILPLLLVFIAMFGALIYRLYDLQIIEGEEYQEEYLDETKRTLYTAATRGNIYDCNGYLLAYNQLTYAVTVTDNGYYADGYAKNKMLLSLVRVLEPYDVTYVTDIPIALSGDGTFSFTTESTSKLRSFLRDFYGVTTSQLDTYDKDGELQYRTDVTAEEIYEEYLTKYGIGQESAKEADGTYDFTKEEGLRLINMRYAMASSYYRQYEAVTLATGLDTESMTAVKEASANLLGVEIAQQTIRVYNDPYAFAHILGYTGKVSTDDLETLQAEAEEAGVAEEKNYALNDVVGKAGIESYMELELSGTKGISEIYVDSMGRIVETVSEESAVAGNDVYLTIDRDLQVAVYNLIEQMLAGILTAKIKNVEPDSTDVTSSKYISIKTVYNQLISNNVLTMSDFEKKDASEVEQTIYAKMDAERTEVMETIRYQLTREDPTPYNELTENEQTYNTYILKILKDGGYVVSDRVDQTDETYLAWTAGDISLKEYLYYAIRMNWIDTTKLGMEEKYPTADTIYGVMLDTVMGILENNSDFCKKIYEILIYDGEISGRELCLALYEQGVLEWNDSDVEKLKNSTPSAVYSFILDKIGNLELTPAQLALTPCSGSVVITDVETGEVRALVSYPSYDINRLSGSVDATYYSQLLNDQSTPLYATATQVLRAPGSVFKMISAAAGLEEGVIGEYEQINDTGTYYQFDQQFKLKCWYTAGHGLLDVRGGLTNSCNYFFCEVGYRLSLDEDGNYSSALGLSKLAKYASMFGLDSKSGIEIYESQPSISDENPIPSAIGQGTNTFANIQLNRYVTAIATRGNVYDLTLIQKVTSSVGDTLEEHTPEIVSTVDLKESTWNALWEGMYGVVTQSSVKEAFEDCATSLAGKTGTAQEDTSKPNHARFIGFAPYEDPEIAISVTIPFGYTGTNAAILADEILNYYYGSTTLDEILNAGEAVEAYDGSQRD